MPPKVIDGRFINEPITKELAWTQGKMRYFTGIPCKRGHISERWVSTGGCIQCQNWSKRPAATAPNVVMPPSGIAFPSDVPAGWLDEELIKQIWGRFLKTVPEWLDDELAKRGKERPGAKIKRLLPRLTEQAKEIGWQSYEQMRAAGHTDHQLYSWNFLVKPQMKSDAPDLMDYLEDGGSHKQGVEFGYIVGFD